MPIASNPLPLGDTPSVSANRELGFASPFQQTISMNDTALRVLAGVSTISGTSWSMSSLWGKNARRTITITIYGAINDFNPWTYRNGGGTNVTTSPASMYIAGVSDISVIINTGVTVGASSTGANAFTVDTNWNGTDTINILNSGTISGAGGNGGSGGSAPAAAGTTAGAAGAAAGSALYITRYTTIYNYSIIQVGGVGGGGGMGSTSGSIKLGFTKYGGSGGGGGAGTVVGNGGTGGTPHNYNGGAGSLSAGGGWTATSGITATFGGNGGGPGAAGAASAGGTYAGGAAGNYLNGSANVSWAATGTRYGGVT